VINITKDNLKKNEQEIKEEIAKINIESVENTTINDDMNSTNDTNFTTTIKVDQVAELTNTLQRLQAEFENYKKRIDKDNVNLIKNANVKLVTELLPVLDSFELALKQGVNETTEVTKYRKGLELIYSQLHSTLEGYGLRVIDTKNKKFDPFKHEVLLVKECNEKDDMILQEFQKGYYLNDIIIRHSKVMIAKHTNEKKE
jgi:molecular chaperone GrpE